jgi:hypothetical protein
VKGESWRGPAGISAIAGAAAALVALVALVFSVTGGSSDSDEVPQDGPPKDEEESGPEVTREDVHSVAEMMEILASVRIGLNESQEAHSYSSIVSTPDGSVSMDAPAAWSDLDVDGWLYGEDDERIGAALIASEDISRLYNDWNVAGVFVGVSDRIDATFDGRDFVDASKSFLESNCVLNAEGSVVSTDLDGGYSIWSKCGDADSVTVNYAVQHEDGYVLAALFRLTSEADIEAVDRVLQSVSVERPVQVVGGDTEGDPGDQVIP